MIVGIFTVSTHMSDATITQPYDYNIHLKTTDNPIVDQAENDIKFWTQKLKAAPNQWSYHLKLAQNYSALFTHTDNFDYIIKEQNELKLACAANPLPSATIHQRLAANYIKQHRFADALLHIEKALNIGEKTENSKKMYFDVLMEVGHYDQALATLKGLKNKSNFDYLIRRAKWADHVGELGHAIDYMEQALTIAKRDNNSDQLIWTLTNLGDFYGHDNQIKNSYNAYLGALKLDPFNTYAKKGIAWIAYAHEQNAQEALRIIEGIEQASFDPSIIKFKAELAAFIGDSEQSQALEDQFFKLIIDSDLTQLYTKDLIEYEQTNNTRLVNVDNLLQNELEHRNTPEVYALLAKNLLANGQVTEALKIADTKVYGKTYEPEVLLNIAPIYKSVHDASKLQNIRLELESAAYELGPMTMQTVNTL